MRVDPWGLQSEVYVNDRDTPFGSGNTKQIKDRGGNVVVHANDYGELSDSLGPEVLNDLISEIVDGGAGGTLYPGSRYGLPAGTAHYEYVPIDGATTATTRSGYKTPHFGPLAIPLVIGVEYILSATLGLSNGIGIGIGIEEALESRAIENNAQSNTDAASSATASRTGEDYTVRLQAQGAGLERSVVISSPTPITVAQGIDGLARLRGQLSPKQIAEREIPFQRAERFIRSGPAGGGIMPPGNSFSLPRSDIRVDVEILRGLNFRE